MRLVAVSGLTICFFLGLIGLGLAGLSGCAGESHFQPPKPEPPLPIIIGEVAIVDEEKRFILVDLGPRMSAPPAGATLQTVNGDHQTGTVRASAEQKPPFFAADIIKGHPSAGDEVQQ